MDVGQEFFWLVGFDWVGIGSISVKSEILRFAQNDSDKGWGWAVRCPKRAGTGTRPYMLITDIA